MKSEGEGAAWLRALSGWLLVPVAVGLAFAVFTIYWPRINRDIQKRYTNAHSRFAAQFKAGDTNVPLLAMDWFDDYVVHFCWVTRSGSVRFARDTGYAVQSGKSIPSRFSPGTTNRIWLEHLISALPQSKISSLPKNRQILVSGICSNNWFHRVYDRADVPPALEDLYSATELLCLGTYTRYLAGQCCACHKRISGGIL